MALCICICLPDGQFEYLRINGNQVEHLQEKPWRHKKCIPYASGTGLHLATSTTPKAYRRCKVVINMISALYFLREVRDFTQLRRTILENAARSQVDVLWLKLRPLGNQCLDYKWNEMLRYKLWEQMEMDNVMSWLSTLGGGFSALGERYPQCAERAGKISLRQLCIGLRIGDPCIQARCKLYYSISLIQIGQLRRAKYIIREQYKFALKAKEFDGRLVKMCKGIWMRLQYEYGLRILQKKTKQLKYVTEGCK